ncbi:MAG: hypothetical protein OXO50_15360 [Caldilineaceae bacterium]|nr:hypothetical protein [Caldilineaceae bacterium]
MKTQAPWYEVISLRGVDQGKLNSFLDEHGLQRALRADPAGLDRTGFSQFGRALDPGGAQQPHRITQ